MNKFLKSKLIAKKIKEKLPKFFQIAEIENSKNNKIGMEVGVAREKIVIAFLIYELGEENVNTKIPINKKEVDVIVFNKPISIKTILGKTIKNIKLIWTVDYKKAVDFVQNYKCKADMLLIHVNWGGEGGLFFVKKEIQNNFLERCGKENFFILPKKGTNSRGIEIRKEILKKIIKHEDTEFIKIKWNKDPNLKYNPYKRWIDLWREELKK